MKALLFFLFLLIYCSLSRAQQINGKWLGKITQQSGGFSELYDFELDLRQKKMISGESYAYIPNVLSVKIGLTGYIDGDSIRLSETHYDIRQETMPLSWIACIKQMSFKYHRQGDNEYLKGTWNGYSKDDWTSECLPGEIILSRNKQAVEQFILNDGFQRTFFADTLKPLAQFTPDFQNTSIKKIKEIEVRNRTLELQINDYLNVDNDTVSIYFNRDIIASKQRIAKKQIRLYITLDPRTDLNELILFAENLGKIPPNTSQLIIIDGTNTHRLTIESDKQKSAALYLKYKPQ